LQAGKHLRDAMDNGVVDRGTVRILESIITGIDYRPRAAA
jgi:hypothetical protein